MRQYKQITTEITFRCNAKCPACHRIKPLRIDLNDSEYTITLDTFKKIFYPGFLKQLDWLIFNGNFGDSIMNRNFKEILSYVKQFDTRINIHTNGSFHDKEYWLDIGSILTKNDIVNFDLDGLDDTHSIYRVNTDFNKVLENACTLISTDRPQVHWKYIVFKHNEHQIEKARELAKNKRFHTFSLVKTSRDFFIPTTDAYIHAKKKTNLDSLEKNIICSWGEYKKWYVSPTGLVFRCCWTASHYYDAKNTRFFYPNNIENLFNAKEIPLEKILSYQYWNKLNIFLKGYDRSFSLCKSQCGKIVSSREKIEENLNSGSVTIF